MGEVWVAHHLTLDIPVAVKLMSLAGESRQDLRQRFEREAKAVALLKSPNIVSVFDYGTDGDRPFIVMELLQGTDLLELLRFRPKWALPEVSGLVSQVTKGLTAAHELGIIHRDIKPANIFLTRSGNDVTAKILDFGIAKITSVEQQITVTNAVLGSPYYLSPEQLHSEPLDLRVDLWALAVVTYRLVTGHVPFDGDSGFAIAERILRGDREEVPANGPKGAELEAFFQRALAQRRDERFATAAEFAEAFFMVAGPPGTLLPVLDPLPDAPTLKAARPSVVRPPAAGARSAEPAPREAPRSAEITEDTTEQQQDDSMTVVARRPEMETTPTEINREQLARGGSSRGVPPRPRVAAGTVPMKAVPRVGRPPPHTRARPASAPSAPPPPSTRPPPSRPSAAPSAPSRPPLPAPQEMEVTPQDTPNVPAPVHVQPPALVQPPLLIQPPALVQPPAMVRVSMTAIDEPSSSEGVETVQLSRAARAELVPQRLAPNQAPLEPQPTLLMPTATPLPVSVGQGPVTFGAPPQSGGAWSEISQRHVRPSSPGFANPTLATSGAPNVPSSYPMMPNSALQNANTAPQSAGFTAPNDAAPRGWLDEDAHDTMQMRSKIDWGSKPVLILVALGALAFVFFTWAVVLGFTK